jgi:hypothetical protein
MPSERTFRPGEQHPEAWRQDLNPNRMAGQNVGLDNPHPEQTARTAYDVKEVHRLLEGITDDGLKQIRCCGLARGSNRAQHTSIFAIQVGASSPQPAICQRARTIGTYPRTLSTTSSGIV